MTTPDFEKLRTERNAKHVKFLEKMRAEGYSVISHCSFDDDHACYCACPDGPCEHKWDGEAWESEDGCAQSVTCSRCGHTAIGHDMRVMP